jgi:hypothetical protein
MSIFPTGRPGSRQEPALYRCNAVRDAGGALERPISGEVYMIDEADLEALMESRTPARPSGLTSRH